MEKEARILILSVVSILAIALIVVITLHAAGYNLSYSSRSAGDHGAITGESFGALSVRALRLSNPKPISTNQPDSRFVWFAPIDKSIDFFSLFWNEDEWREARSNIEVYKFYYRMWSYPAYQKQNMISMLNQWEIDIAIEAESLSPFGYSTQVVTERVRSTIGSIESYGGEVIYWTMQEPMHAGLHFLDLDQPAGSLEQGMHETALRVKQCTDQIMDEYPGLKIGVVEPWPGPNYGYTPEVHKAWIDELEKVLGGKLDHYHIDRNNNAVDLYGADYNDLKEIRDYAESKGIRFGIIYNMLGVQSDYDFYQGTRDYLSLAKQIIAEPHDMVFQSWNPVPIHNLPESSGYSFTMLIRDFGRGSFSE